MSKIIGAIILAAITLAIWVYKSKFDPKIVKQKIKQQIYELEMKLEKKQHERDDSLLAHKLPDFERLVGECGQLSANIAKLRKRL